MSLRKLVTDGWVHVFPGLVLGMGSGGGTGLLELHLPFWGDCSREVHMQKKEVTIKGRNYL